MTEIDKSLVERLVEPLTHLVRNAVDHGVEKPAVRTSSGKAPEGRLKLSAEHRSGQVVIQISDDGQGLDRAKILEKAVKKGVVSKEVRLTDGEIDSLLFKAGFSTADTVTNLSGRGVGLDVVQTQIQSMGGRVTISSSKALGTTFAISLPLTLAVLDGMVVRCAGHVFVFPLSCVVETLTPRPNSIKPLAQRGSVIEIRDDFVQVVSLADILKLARGAQGEELQRILLHISADETRAIAVVVDEIVDQRQVVIKSLEENYGNIPGISAATILGDGRIALIVDPDKLLELAMSAPSVISTAVQPCWENSHV